MTDKVTNREARASKNENDLKNEEESKMKMTEVILIDIDLPILAKMCQMLLVWFEKPILDSFLEISWDSVNIFQNQFLR